MCVLDKDADKYVFLVPKSGLPDNETSYIKIIDSNSKFYGLVFQIIYIKLNDGECDFTFRYRIIEQGIYEIEADENNKELTDEIAEIILDILQKYYVNDEVK